VSPLRPHPLPQRLRERVIKVRMRWFFYNNRLDFSFFVDLDECFHYTSDSAFPQLLWIGGEDLAHRFRGRCELDSR
jgi:hypothetical protein